MENSERQSQAEASAQRELAHTAARTEGDNEQKGLGWLSGFGQDLRYGLRILWKSRILTSVSVLTLLLGIGASTAIFSVVYGVLLRPLPYDKPDQIVRVWEADSRGRRIAFADPNLEDLRAEVR